MGYDHFMKKLLTIAAITAAMASLSACETWDNLVGNTREGPDEFAVYQRAPLSIPPDFGLRPPAPGAERPGALNPKGQAKTAVLGVEAIRTESLTDDVSAGTRALLKQTHADQAEPDIRTIVQKETRELAVEDETVGQKVLFWSATGEYGRVIDADKEARRIKENEALGKSATDPAIPSKEPQQQPQIRREER